MGTVRLFKFSIALGLIAVILSSCLSPKEVVNFSRISAATYQGVKQVIGKKMSEAKDSVSVETTVAEE